ncbi:SUR7/PalI family-domain-containing protein [Nemania sp. FL0916]|nr:SUR7/PalI family-domain-containing protein [Nemania sp. FL0916]
MAVASVSPIPSRQGSPDDIESQKTGRRGDSIEDRARLKRGTRTRRNAIVVSCLLYLFAIIFLILVEVGNTRGDTILGSMYFFKLDLTNVLAKSAPSNLTLQNSIARTLGLHDFYQVGLWNFCEGYKDEGITHCSKPTAWFWFNPVDILLSELLAGASIELPSEVNDILNILRIASHVMFDFFVGGLALNATLLICSPIVLYSRWWSLPAGIISGVAATVVVVAASLSTAISYIFQAALDSQPDLGVSASVGMKMLAFEWSAAGLTLLAFIIQAWLGCCCTSRRDMRIGRRGGRNQQNTAGLPRYESPVFEMHPKSEEIPRQ